MQKKRILRMSIFFLLCASVAFAEENESAAQKVRKGFSVKSKAAEPATQKAAAAKETANTTAAPVQPAAPIAVQKNEGAIPGQAATPAIEKTETASKPENAAETPKPKPIQDVKEMTKEELIAEIMRMLASSNQISAVVPNIQMIKDANGAVSYLYKNSNGTTTPLADLDKAVLESLYLKIRSEFIRIGTEKTMKMMNDIKNIEKMNRQQRMISSVQTPNVKTYKPPAPITNPTANLPKTPKLPPSIPRTNTR